jgi:hypothetical protein
MDSHGIVVAEDMKDIKHGFVFGLQFIVFDGLKKG